MTFSTLFAPSVAVIRGNSQAFQTIGENIANSATTGFKTADTRFVEVLSANAATEFASLGGIRPTAQFFIDRQGLMQASDRPLDIGISGRGFLIGNTAVDESGQYQLTRAGALSLTSVDVGGGEETYLTDLAGNFVLAWPADSLGNFSPGAAVTSLDPIRLDAASVLFSPVATSTASLDAILPSNAATGDSHTAPIPVIDAAGAEHALALQFTRTATPNVWTLAASVGGGAINSGGGATVTFDATGALVSPASQSIGIAFGGTGGSTTVAVDLTGLRSYAGAFTVTALRRTAFRRASRSPSPSTRTASCPASSATVRRGRSTSCRSRPCRTRTRSTSPAIRISR